MNYEAIKKIPRNIEVRMTIPDYTSEKGIIISRHGGSIRYSYHKECPKPEIEFHGELTLFQRIVLRVVGFRVKRRITGMTEYVANLQRRNV